jgi:2,4-dienoyl-CoA reductase-like NADH-dependent reductase (Old Yellow Enzyme family)
LQEPDPSKKNFIYWAEKNLRDGNTDMVGIGRQSLADPLFPKKVLSGETEAIDYCTTCDRCLALMLAQKEVGCAVHNEYYRDLYRRVKKETRS